MFEIQLAYLLHLDLQNSLLVPLPQPNRKSDILNDFCSLLKSCMCCISKNSANGFNPINFKCSQAILNTFVTKSNSKLEVVLNNMTVEFPDGKIVICVVTELTTNCC